MKWFPKGDRGRGRRREGKGEEREKRKREKGRETREGERERASERERAQNSKVIHAAASQDMMALHTKCIHSILSRAHYWSTHQTASGSATSAYEWTIRLEKLPFMCIKRNSN